MIKQRIRDETFDDPIRLNAAEGSDTRQHGDEEVLDYQKSKKGLAELYEDKYKVDVLHYARSPEEEKTKDEIKVLLSELFHKFDQLSNFHFVPARVDDEIKVCVSFLRVKRRSRPMCQHSSSRRSFP